MMRFTSPLRSSTGESGFFGTTDAGEAWSKSDWRSMTERIWGSEPIQMHSGLSDRLAERRHQIGPGEPLRALEIRWC